MKLFRSLKFITTQCFGTSRIQFLRCFNNHINLSHQRRFCIKNNTDPHNIHLEFDEPARKYIEFTCKQCNTRIKKTFSKVAYEKGVVIIKCDGCQSNHLIADNLGWISDNKKWNVESLSEKTRDEN